MFTRIIWFCTGGFFTYVFLRSRKKKSVGEAIAEFFSRNNQIYKYIKDKLDS